MNTFCTRLCENETNLKVIQTVMGHKDMAYKSLEDIIDVIRESVDVIDVMKPIYNYKASD